MKKLLGTLTVGICLTVASSALAVGIGLNPSTPLGGYDLGGGQYATLIGVQSTSSLVGQTITSADLFAAINSGTVLGFYYSSGNFASGDHFDTINAFGLFSTDTVSYDGSGNNARIFDSLYAIHTGTVVFNNGSGGTTTMSTGGTRVAGQNPFAHVPDGGSTLTLMGIALAGLGSLRRKLFC